MLCKALLLGLVVVAVIVQVKGLQRDSQQVSKVHLCQVLYILLLFVITFSDQNALVYRNLEHLRL